MLRNQQVLQSIDRFLIGILDCVQIVLRRGDIAVTEPRLYLPDIDTGVKEQGRRSVAQGMNLRKECSLRQGEDEFNQKGITKREPALCRFPCFYYTSSLKKSESIRLT